MFKRLTFVALVAGSISPAQAATWNGFKTAYTDSFLVFFDAETVSRQGDIVTVWLKYVNNPDKPDAGGAYSSAVKEKYFCSTRTSQVFVTATFDKNGAPIMTTSTPSATVDVIPGTIGETMFKIICSPGFPNDTSETLYGPVAKNDPVGFTLGFFQYAKSLAAQPASK